MAPKTTAGSKRKGSSSTIDRPLPAPRNPDPSRFKSEKAYARFLELEKKETWHDKIFQINPEGEFAEIQQIFTNRQWEKLLHPHPHINLDLLREFYANAVPNCDLKEIEARFTYSSKVRGVTIRFDRDTINEYLGNPFDLPPGEDPTIPVLCEYGEKAATGNWPHDRIKREILLPGRQYVLSKAGNRNIAAFAGMTVRATMVFKFLVHNVWPKSHVTKATKVVTPLIWHICRGGEVDVARIVSEELKHMALSGVTRPKTRITF